MNLTISGHHLEVTPAIRTYVQSKLERVTRHFDHVIDAHVILTVDKLRQKAEVTLHVRGKDLPCAAEEQDHAQDRGICTRACHRDGFACHRDRPALSRVGLRPQRG